MATDNINQTLEKIEAEIAAQRQLSAAELAAAKLDDPSKRAALSEYLRKVAAVRNGIADDAEIDRTNAELNRRNGE